MTYRIAAQKLSVPSAMMACATGPSPDFVGDSAAPQSFSLPSRERRRRPELLTRMNRKPVRSRSLPMSIAQREECAAQQF
jgi:hypothetical protein